MVTEFQKLFLATWNHQKGTPLATRNYFPDPGSQGSEVVRAIGSSPDEPYSQIYATLLSAINSAETEVFLTNAYFVPDPQLLAALKQAVQRGVDVRLLLPARTDSKLVFHASRSYYEELLVAGVKIYERQDALLHAKTALVDGVWSTVGSTNLDWRSFLNNQEINAVVLGQAFGARMKAMFEKDLESSTRVLLEQWRQRSLGVRLKERAARLWAPGCRLNRGAGMATSAWKCSRTLAAIWLFVILSVVSISRTAAGDMVVGEPLPELALGLAGPEDQDGIGIADGCDHPIVVPVEMARERPLAAVIRLDELFFVGGRRALSIDAARPVSPRWSGSPRSPPRCPRRSRSAPCGGRSRVLQSFSCGSPGMVF